VREIVDVDDRDAEERAGADEVGKRLADLGHRATLRPLTHREEDM
jgi:hypothetical protein